MMRKPKTPSGWLLTNSQKRFGRSGIVSSWTEGVVATVAMAPVPSRQADARIEPAIEQIHEQVHEDEDGGDQQHQALNEVEIAARGGVDEELADAVDVEHLLGHDEAADQERELEADDGDDRQHGVAQRVAAHDQVRPHALVAGGAV